MKHGLVGWLRHRHEIMMLEMKCGIWCGNMDMA